MNSFEWDLLVDQELALAAESADVKAAKDSTAQREEDKRSSLADTPYAESVRLGHTLYAVPGDYTVRVSLGENSGSAEMKIKAAKGYEPRAKPADKIRGK